MRRFLYVIESATPPPINCIWLYKGEFKYHTNGKWITINNPTDLKNTEEGAYINIEAIKLNNTTEDKKNNIEVCSKYGTSDVISIDIEGTYYGIKYDAIGIYHNGTVSILEGNHCTVFDIDFNTGEVTLNSKYDTSRFLPYVDLEIGDAYSVREYNKERLQTGVFFCNIDYGYGVGSWNSITGGQATVITSYNHAVHYIIDANGSVSKQLETPDIYFEYVNKGGTKSGEEFALALKNLVDN